MKRFASQSEPDLALLKWKTNEWGRGDFMNAFVTTLSDFTDTNFLSSMGGRNNSKMDLSNEEHFRFKFFLKLTPPPPLRGDYRFYSERVAPFIRNSSKIRPPRSAPILYFSSVIRAFQLSLKGEIVVISTISNNLERGVPLKRRGL